MNRDNPRRRLVRSTGILADQKADREALAELIRHTPGADAHWRQAVNIAQRVLDAGYRRLVVDDALVEKGARAMFARVYPVHDWDSWPDETELDDFRGHARAALVAALGADR